MDQTDINRTVERFDDAARRERPQPPDTVQPTKSTRYPASVKIKIFKVQSAAAGDGVYDCYEQTLDATEWEDTDGDDKFDDKEDEDSVEVLSLLESDPESSYASALAVGDRLQCWKWTDDEENDRWVGIPLVSNPVRKAKTTQAAPSQEYITANLYKHDDTEITSGLGSNIDVYCNVNGGGNLDKSIPLLKDDQDIFVVNIQGKWWCEMPFNIGGPQTAWVKTTPTGTTVTCYLSHTDNTGQEITVTPTIIGGGNLSDAIPKPQDGTPLTVTKVGSTFRCVNIFQALNTDQLEVDESIKELQTTIFECEA